MKLFINTFLALLLVFAQANACSAVQEFCQAFDARKSNNYTELLHLGEKVLRTSGIQANERAQVHARLASINYYLGNYTKVEEHALSCQECALNAADSELVARSLYLLSAYHRAEGLQTEIPVKNEHHFNQARLLIQKALDLVKTIETPALKAKIFLNAGAAYADDPTGDASKALPYYQKALELLPQESSDTYRILIRLSRGYLLTGNVALAWKTLTPLFKKDLEGRVRVHLYFTAAQIALAEGNTSEAEIYSVNTQKMATNLRLQGDQKRIQHLQKEICTKKAR